MTDLRPSATGSMCSRASAARRRSDHHRGRERLELIASELQRRWPDLAAPLREGLDNTLTPMRFGMIGQLAKTLCSTGPCESMIWIVRTYSATRNAGTTGDMRKPWRAAGMLRRVQFRRIIGFRPQARDHGQSSRRPHRRERSDQREILLSRDPRPMRVAGEVLRPASGQGNVVRCRVAVARV